NGIPIHLNHRDVTFTAVSRAPLAKIETYKKRMGWSFPWVSSYGSDFNFDYQVSFTPEQIAEGKAYYNYEIAPNTLSEQVGISVFYKNDRGEVFHTYSCYSRGVDMLNGAYHYLDLAPKGRDEDGLEFSMEWVRRHDHHRMDRQRGAAQCHLSSRCPTLCRQGRKTSTTSGSAAAATKTSPAGKRPKSLRRTAPRSRCGTATSREGTSSSSRAGVSCNR